MSPTIAICFALAALLQTVGSVWFVWQQRKTNRDTRVKIELLCLSQLYTKRAVDVLLPSRRQVKQAVPVKSASGDMN
jgi:hypothetical protein